MRVGDYDVIGEIGRGGMGVVHKGRAPDGRLVAIKLLKLAPTPEARARFDRERRLLAGFAEADGFVPLLDAGDSPQGPFAVMPFVGGGTLRARLDEGALSIEASLELLRQLARALGRAHARGVVHRDLKPENVLFEGERALVADLGLAKHFRGDVSGASQSVELTVRGRLAGTVGYTAPEQMADALGVGPAADVFSLGAILHECLAGEPAFQGMSALDLIQKVNRCEPTPVERVRGDVPPWLAAVVRRSLAKDPRERFADGHALAAALEGAGTSTTPPERRKLLGGVVAAGLGALALVLGIAFGLARHEENVRRARAPAEAEATRARQLEDDRSWHELEARVARTAAIDVKETLVAAYLVEHATGAHAPEARALEARLTRQGWALETLPGLRRGRERPIDLWNTQKGLELALVYVPPGDFIMGNDAGVTRERPQHSHPMPRGYWIGRADVTWAEYGVFCASVGRAPPETPPWWNELRGDRSRHPVVDVSWDGAVAFCEWAGLALPTEVEWEKAARGTDGRRFPWGDAWDPRRCNFLDASCPGDRIVATGRTLDEWAANDGGRDRVHDDGHPYTSPVDAYPEGASPWGALDMAGNVWQFCDDWYDERIYAEYALGRWATPRSTGPGKVVRGGAWNTTRNKCTTSMKSARPQANGETSIGFRVVLRSGG